MEDHQESFEIEVSFGTEVSFAASTVPLNLSLDFWAVAAVHCVVVAHCAAAYYAVAAHRVAAVHCVVAAPIAFLGE